jgi:hypothetical protein
LLETILAFERIADQANSAHGITYPHEYRSMACRDSKASNVMTIGATHAARLDLFEMIAVS